MASYTQTAGALSLRDRWAAMTETLRTRYAQHRVYRSTLEELQSLSDRDLADLGVSRAQLRDDAYQAAYGA